MTKPKAWLAIDPGATGALALITESEVLFIDYSNTVHPYAEAITYAQDVYTLQMCAVEKVHAMPNQGVTSMFSFGTRFGELIGMFQTLNVGFELVRPQLWQKHCNIKPKSTKKQAAQALLQIYPSASLFGPKNGLLDGRSDALGIAHYLRKTYP